MDIPSDTLDDSRNPKRRREELDTEPLVDHPTQYYEDGNVILQCGRTVFRIHRTVIIKVSTVFQEMLAPDHIHETIRGCTLLRLDDNESDMESFLNALYGERMIIGLPQITRENFPPLSSVLCLAHKYRVAHLKSKFLAALHAAWPSHLPHYLQSTHNLAACHASLQYIQALPIDLPEVIDPEVDTDTTTNLPIHPAAVIALLRAINYDDQGLLMALFYDISRRTPQLSSGVYINHPLSCLAPADIERFVVGLARLRMAQVQMYTSPMLVAVPEHWGTCHSHIHAFWTYTAQPLLLLPAGLMSQPIEDLETVRQMVRSATTESAFPWSVCSACRTEVLQYVEREQAELWRSMSTFFALE